MRRISALRSTPGPLCFAPGCPTAHQTPVMSYRGRGRGGGSRGRGRGAYYAAKYGNRSRHNTSRNGPTEEQRQFETTRPRVHGDRAALSEKLHSIDGAPYPNYKALLGTWNLSQRIALVFDRIQSDAYAPPSRARLRVSLEAASFPKDLHAGKTRQVAFCDYLTRKFWRIAHECSLDRRKGGQGWSGSKGGDISVDKPGQHVLERTSCLLDGDFIELRFTVGLPARGRSIEGSDAAYALTEVLPGVAEQSLFVQSDDVEKLREHVLCVEDQDALRNKLEEIGLIAFVRNGAVLPRASGACDEPMTGDAVVRFESPEQLAVEISLPSGRTVRGMGIKPGISLIVGGGFHGKSTLLAALEVGVYNHVPCDGREFVAVHRDTVSIRAEDGRSVSCVDITPFINNLPFGKDTSSFSTPDASGSTSQATNIIEALEAGAKVLLTDEDLAATNFMMRDQRMAKLVPSNKEPITPMIQRIRALHKQEGVSSILVVGGAGDYFEVSDLVVMMDAYKPRDVTKEAKKIAKAHPSGLNLDIANVPREIFKTKRKRGVVARSVNNIKERGRGRVGAKVRSAIEFGAETIDLSAVSQIVEVSQTRAIGAALERIGGIKALEEEGISAAVHKMNADIEVHGLDAINDRGEKIGNYSRPRTIEVQAALNRLRGIQVVKKDES